jgi:hypothetical protein
VTIDVFNCNKSNLTAIAIWIINCIIDYVIQKKNSPKYASTYQTSLKRVLNNKSAMEIDENGNYLEISLT